ncbi:MAG: hypothetical protein WBN27_03470 [Eudoraea sp.]|uniref:hypothetical protein n=1 Tax=Eudoraea sp. TaxID=1979955 RepID=UPI003C75B2DC
MKVLNLNYFFILLGLTLFFTISCASDDNSPEIAVVPATRTIDPELVGIWNGTVEGTLGSANVSFTLQQDGAISAETDSQVLCPFSGSWWVSGGKFEASGEDECDGTSISLRGNGASSIKISGNWTASSGNNGNFSMTKL